MTATTLRHALLPRNEIVHPRDNPSGDGVFVGLEHIEPNTGKRIGAVHIRLERMNGRKARFYPGDVVYGYLRPYLNKVWVAEFDGYCSVDQYVFRVNPSFDPRYVAAFLRSPLFLERAPVSETPGQLPRIRLDEVLDVRWSPPSHDEQSRIAEDLGDALRSVEELAEQAAAQREAITLLPAAILRRAFERERARERR